MKSPKENLQLILNKFIQEIKPEQFDFSCFVREYDHKHNCGTVCCIVGWFPKLFPNAGFKWVGNDLTSPTGSINVHLSYLIGCDLNIINYLFYGMNYISQNLMPNDGGKYELPRLNAFSSYDDVIKGWQFIIEHYDRLPQSNYQYETSKFTLDLVLDLISVPDPKIFSIYC